MPNVPNNTLQVVGIRSGISRNDGTNGLGTPSLSHQIVVNSVAGIGGLGFIDNIPTQEQDDSPTFEWAEQCTVTHKYEGSYNNCITLGSIYQRGALVTDDFANFYRVLSNTVQHQKAGRATMVIVTESISFDVPPDEFNCQPVKLGLDIMKHPRYFYAIMPTNQIPNYVGNLDTNSQIAAKQAIIRAIQAYRENPYIPTSANINGVQGLLHDSIVAAVVSGSFVIAKPNPGYDPTKPTTGPDPIGTTSPSANPHLIYISVQTSSSDPNGKIALALAAMQELIGKLWRMEDTPLVNGVEMTHTEYWFRPPFLNLGGYVEDPFGIGTRPYGVPAASPIVPDYFYSTDNPPTQIAADTIFAKLSYYNPQLYALNGLYGGPNSISWLRDADTIEYARTWFRVTRKWLGAPVGAWDMDIYNAVLSQTPGNRPQIPSEYRNLILS